MIFSEIELQSELKNSWWRFRRGDPSETAASESGPGVVELWCVKQVEGLKAELQVADLIDLGDIAAFHEKEIKGDAARSSKKATGHVSEAGTAYTAVGGVITANEGIGVKVSGSFVDAALFDVSAFLGISHQ